MKLPLNLKLWNRHWFRVKSRSQLACCKEQWLAKISVHLIHGGLKSSSETSQPRISN